MIRQTSAKTRSDDPLSARPGKNGIVPNGVAAQQTAALFETIWATVPDGIAVTDADGIFIAANPAYCRLYGYDQEAILGRPLTIAFPEEQHEEVLAQYRTLLASSDPGRSVVLRVRRVNGEERVVEGHFDFIEVDGQRTAMVSIVRDITDRNVIEIALATSEERYRRLVDDLHVGVLLKGPQTEIRFANPAAAALLGMPVDELLGKRSADAAWDIRRADGTHFPGAAHPASQAVATRAPVRGVVMGVRRPIDHERVWLMADAVPQLAPDGSITELVCTFSDITERKEAEEALREREERFRDLANAVPALVWQTDAAGAYTFVNDRLQTITGWTEAEEFHDVWAAAIHPDDRRRCLEVWRTALATSTPFTIEYRLRRHDGTYCWLLDEGRPRFTPSGEPIGFIGAALDITERKRGESALQQLTDQLLRVQDEERRHIARELHDTTAQTLVAASLNLARLQQLIPAGDDEITQILAESRAMGEQALREIRGLSYLLHPPALEQRGLQDVLQWYVTGYAQRSGVDVELIVPHDLELLPNVIETTLLRVTQEVLTNVHHHSGSERAVVALEVTDGRVELRVRDFGRGVGRLGIISPEADLYKSGVGIAGIRERLRQLGGRLDIIGMEAGIEVVAWVPLPNREHPT